MPNSTKDQELQRVGAKKKYVERFDRYDRASIAKWLASVVDKAAQDQEDAQDLIDEIADSDDPRAGQNFSKLLKDHIANQNHIMTWALDKLERIDELAKKPTPESKSETAATPVAPAI
ncbi:MAG: hypothetical protein WC505_06715 [Patescibacteria group bacterium]